MGNRKSIQPVKGLTPPILKVLVWVNFGGPGLIQSDLSENELQQKLKVVRPRRCPEIPEILKVVLKFTPRAEFFADVLNFLSTPVNDASMHL